MPFIRSMMNASGHYTFRYRPSPLRLNQAHNNAHTSPRSRYIHPNHKDYYIPKYARKDHRIQKRRVYLVAVAARAHMVRSIFPALPNTYRHISAHFTQRERWWATMAAHRAPHTCLVINVRSPPETTFLFSVRLLWWWCWEYMSKVYVVVATYTQPEPHHSIVLFQTLKIYTPPI